MIKIYLSPNRASARSLLIISWVAVLAGGGFSMLGGFVSAVAGYLWLLGVVLQVVVGILALRGNTNINLRATG